ncbi:MAG: BON domain-containing protein [Candidatus Geothermincolia bacterium]
MKILTVAAVLAAFVALALTSAPVRSSEMDEQIERTARNLYVFKTYLKGDDITIKARDGVVTLTGTVFEEPSSVLAEETVASLRGVRSVDNKLEIKGERPAENSDGWIAARVKTVLFFHRSVSGVKTGVSVTDGVVTLRGEATSQAQKELTTEYAKDVEGVRDVNNEMTVSTSLETKIAAVGEKIDDASITAQVKMSMLFHRSTRVFKTHVETDNGVVTLTGTTKNLAEKDLITKLVEDVNGVAKVDNRMTVAEPKGK